MDFTTPVRTLESGQHSSGICFSNQVAHQALIFDGPRAVTDSLDFQAADGAPDAFRSGRFPGMGGSVKTH